MQVTGPFAAGFWLLPVLGHSLVDWTAGRWSSARGLTDANSLMMTAWWPGPCAAAILVLLAVTAAAGWMAGWIQNGFQIQSGAFSRPLLARLRPGAGGLWSAARLGSIIIQAICFAGLGALLVQRAVADPGALLALRDHEPGELVLQMMLWVAAAGAALTVGLLVAGLLDWTLQRWCWARRMQMTDAELREEARQDQPAARRARSAAAGSGPAAGIDRING